MTERPGSKTPENLGHQPGLKRSLTLLDLTVYGLIFITPIAPFSTFGIVFNASHGMVPLVYVVGLVAMALTAMSYGTMAETFPVAGSVYSYATQSIGKRAGFFAGWALLLDYLLIPGFILVICAVAIHSVWPGPPKVLWVALFLALNTAINLAGIKQTARTGLALLIVQLALLAWFVALCASAVAHGVGGAHVSLIPLFSADRLSPQLLFAALSLAVVSFLGFDGISTLAEESAGAPNIVGRAILLALSIAATLFILQTYAASLFVLNRTSFAAGAETDEALYGVAALVGGPSFKFFVSIFGVTLAGISGALAAQGAAARLLFGMARDGRLPSILAHINSARRVPDVATVAVAVLTLLVGVALVDRLDLLASMVNFGAVTGFILLHISVVALFVWRKRSRDWVRHLLVPAGGIAVLLYVLVNAQPEAKVAAAAWFALGALFLWSRAQMPLPATSQRAE